MLGLKISQMITKTIISIVLLVGIFFAFLIWFTPGDTKTSFIAGYFISGFIWGWSITKKWFPNYSFFSRNSSYSSSSSMEAMKETMHGAGVAFRWTAAVAAGAIALPVGLIITIISIIVNVTKATNTAMAEAEAEIQATKNTQEDVQQQTVPAEITQESAQETNNQNSTSQTTATSKRDVSGTAIAGLVLGIIGLFFPLFFIGIPLSVTGKKKLFANGQATTIGTVGLVINIVVACLWVIGILALVSLYLIH